jgi:hypothetical protein
MTDTVYTSAILAAQGLLAEQIRDPKGEANPEYTRGVVEAIAEIWPKIGVTTYTRKLEVARDIGLGVEGLL